MSPILFAVHLSDGVVAWPWILGGFAVAIPLLAMASLRIRDEEIPRIGMLSAAIFIGSQIHFHLGVTSVHLLLNGLAGVLLGRRATLAIAVGLTLQALLFGHGGKWTWGLNVCVMSLPAILAGISFSPLRRLLALAPLPVRFAFIAAIFAVCLAAVTTAIQVTVCKLSGRSPRELLDGTASFWIATPAPFAALIVASMVLSGMVVHRQRPDAEAFTAGLLLGLLSGFLTVALNATVISLGGIDGVRATASIAFLAHVPVIAVEAIGVAIIVAYLAKVKPEWLPDRNPSAR